MAWNSRAAAEEEEELVAGVVINSILMYEVHSRFAQIPISSSFNFISGCYWICALSTLALSIMCKLVGADNVKS